VSRGSGGRRRGARRGKIWILISISGRKKKPVGGGLSKGWASE